MEDISKIIFVLLKKKFNGVINLGSGKGILLKEIANVIGEKYKKEISFLDNKKKTHLIANTKLLKKLYKIKIPKDIKKIIF